MVRTFDALVTVTVSVPGGDAGDRRWKTFPCRVECDDGGPGSEFGREAIRLAVAEAAAAADPKETPS